MGVIKGRDKEAIITILLSVTFLILASFLFTVNLGTFVSADVNVTSGTSNFTIAGNGTNHSSSQGAILFNVTFINKTDILIGDLAQGTTNVTFHFNGSNDGSAIPTIGIPGSANSSVCAISETAGTNTLISCWGFLTINATHDGLWNVTAYIYNGSTSLNAANGTQNGYLIRFDSSVPNVAEANFTNLDTGSNLSSTKNGTIIINVSISDTGGGIQTVYFNVTNSSGAYNTTIIPNNAAGNMWNATIKTQDYLDGTYNISVHAFDYSNNSNTSALVHTIVFDNTGPTGTFSCTPSPINEGSTETCTCSSSDATSGVQTTTFTASPSTSGTGTHDDETCSITDYSGNGITLSTSFSVEAAGSSSTTSSGGGGSSSSSGTPSAGTPSLAPPEPEPEKKTIIEKIQDAKTGQGDTGAARASTGTTATLLVVAGIIIIIVVVAAIIIKRRRSSALTTLKTTKKK